jgi:hypothetical protein
MSSVAYWSCAPPHPLLPHPAGKVAAGDQVVWVLGAHHPPASERIELAEQIPSTTGKVIGLAQQGKRDKATPEAVAANAPDESSCKPGWRAALTNPWTIAICAPLIVGALIAIRQRRRHRYRRNKP